MKKTLLTLVTFLVLLALYTTWVKADSLWNEGVGSLYEETPRHFKVGDLITVIIVEQATASQNAESSNGKKDSVSADAGTGALKFLPELGAGWDSEYEGTGSTVRKGSLSAKLTVTVAGMTPEGALLIEGSQVIKVNKEDQVLKVRGKIRPEDVSADNTVYSTFVADAEIEYQGKGTVGETQSSGILSRFFHWLF